MFNAFFLGGTLKKLTINEAKNPNKNASAVLLIQYGVQREATGNAVEFVNAVLVRVPSYKFASYRNRLRVGQTVEITGHLQGIYKTFADQGFFTVELVADRIDVASEPAASDAGVTPAEPTTEG